MKTKAVLVLIVFTILFARFNKPVYAAADLEQWINPNYDSSWHDLSTPAWGSYFTNPSQLTGMLSRINVFGMFEEATDSNPGNFLSHLIPLFKNNNISISVEGAPAKCSNPSTQWANYTVNHLIKPIYDNGGSVGYFSIDTLPNTLLNCSPPLTMDQIVSETVNFMKILHTAHPEIKFGLISNFPNYGYGNNISCTGEKVDYKAYLETMLAGVVAQGEKLYFVHADNPYDYANGTLCKTNPSKYYWIDRIVDLEKQVKSHGLRFGLIFNSATPGRNGTDQRFYTDTLTYMNEYKTRGGNPDDIIIESWYPHPTNLFPDTTLYTFSNLVKNTLQVKGATPGDINGDGKVDMTDYKILVNNFGKTGLILSDINRDGKVDIFDYNILVADYSK